MVIELHKRAAKAKLKEFRTATYIPKIARDRKNAVDKILLEYKKRKCRFPLHRAKWHVRHKGIN